MVLKGGGGLQGVEGSFVARPYFAIGRYDQVLHRDYGCQHFAMGAVLSKVQDYGKYLIAYERRKMNVAEMNYPVHERELLAGIYALRTWCHY